MSSFRGVNLRHKGFNQNFRRRQLPVSPTEPHPDHGTLLYLRNGHVMDRNSYVNTYRRHEVNIEHLERYPGGIRCFTDDSLQTIIRMSGYKPQTRSPQHESSVSLDSHFHESSANRRLRESFVNRSPFGSSRTVYVEEALRTFRSPRPVRISTALVERFKIIGILKDTASTLNDGETHRSSAPHLPLSEPASSEVRSYVVAPVSRPTLLSTSSSPPTPSALPVHPTPIQSTPYAYGGITPSPFPDSVKISQPAARFWSAAFKPRCPGISPLLPRHTQGLQDEAIEPNQEPRTTSSSLGASGWILSLALVLFTGFYVWIHATGHR
jgi:hypothetical protein